MPYTQPWFEVDFGSAYASIGTTGYRLYQATGADSVARTTTGVVDLGNGGYGVAAVNVPDNAVGIEWDTGGGSPVFAREDLAVGSIEQKVDRLDEALISASWTVAAGTTNTIIQTDSPKVNNYYAGQAVALVDGPQSAVRNVLAYSQTNGTFTLDDSLNFTPAPGATLYVLTNTSQLAMTSNRLDEFFAVVASGNPVSNSWLDIILNTGAGAFFDRNFASLTALAQSRTLLPNQNDFNQVTVVAGSSTTVVNTTATDAAGFWDENTLVVVRAASNGAAVARIVSYAGAGVFNVDPPLPFTPVAGDVIYVTPGAGSASSADVDAILANTRYESTDIDLGTGVMTVYTDSARTTVLNTWQLYSDKAGTTPYNGTAPVHRRDRLS